MNTQSQNDRGKKTKSQPTLDAMFAKLTDDSTKRYGTILIVGLILIPKNGMN